ncbi:MAG: hypothetical protein CL569_00015 [Alphaproteobacteria bacterium]|nr:hypothetical protein [Alphaproteobacteria bacterium]
MSVLIVVSEWEATADFLLAFFCAAALPLRAMRPWRWRVITQGSMTAVNEQKHSSIYTKLCRMRRTTREQNAGILETLLFQKVETQLTYTVLYPRKSLI